MTVGQLTRALEAHYPHRLVADWDRVGLVTGNPEAPVHKVLFVVDVTPETVAQAVELHADLVIAHHPLLLRGVHTVAANTPKGALLHRLIRAGDQGIALYVAHTNADAASNGVSDALAKALGLQQLKPLVSAPAELDYLTVFLPNSTDVNGLIDAVSAEIGPVWGDYTRCAWWTTGTGTFTPGPTANPTIGVRGQASYLDEIRVEMAIPRHRREAALSAMYTAHPYEVPAFQLVELSQLDSSQGLARIGQLPSSMRFREFVAHVARNLPVAPAGIRGAGNPERTISTVAVCGGAGDSLLDAVHRAGVDAYVTADLRHHPVSEQLASDGPALVDAGHWATERPWLDIAAALVTEQFGTDVECIVSQLITDPWTIHIGNTGGEV